VANKGYYTRDPSAAFSPSRCFSFASLGLPGFLHPFERFLPSLPEGRSLPHLRTYVMLLDPSSREFDFFLFSRGILLRLGTEGTTFCSASTWVTTLDGRLFLRRAFSDAPFLGGFVKCSFTTFFPSSSPKDASVWGPGCSDHPPLLTLEESLRRRLQFKILYFSCRPTPRRMFLFTPWLCLWRSFSEDKNRTKCKWTRKEVCISFLLGPVDLRTFHPLLLRSRVPFPLRGPARRTRSDIAHPAMRCRIALFIREANVRPSSFSLC